MDLLSANLERDGEKWTTSTSVVSNEGVYCVLFISLLSLLYYQTHYSCKYIISYVVITIFTIIIHHWYEFIAEAPPHCCHYHNYYHHHHYQHHIINITIILSPSSLLSSPSSSSSFFLKADSVALPDANTTHDDRYDPIIERAFQKKVIIMIIMMMEL